MWWLLWILPIILFILIIYLFVAPFYFEIDSRNGKLEFRLHKIAHAQIIILRDSIFLQYRIAWWEKEIDLLAPKKIKKQIPAHTKVAKKKRSFKLKHMPQRILAVLKSFSLKECYISIDTGNYPANGILYPWFYLLGAQTGKTIMINFWGENEIILTIKNSCARICKAFIMVK